MEESDYKLLKQKIDSILQDLVGGLKKTTGGNLLSLCLTGSTVQGEMKYNQDVDLIVVLKDIPEEDLTALGEMFDKIMEGGLDLPYEPNIPEVRHVFEEICQRHTSDDTGVFYRFTLGNYWGKPCGKKFTIHLHVIGPHSLESLQFKIDNYHKVVLANAIKNSKILAGDDLEKLVKIDVRPADILKVLRMLKKRQESAVDCVDNDPDLALQISIKNLGKIAMASLEFKGIFESSTVKAGQLFSEHFHLLHSDLPKQAFQFKVEKGKLLLDKAKLIEIVQHTSKLLDGVIEYFEEIE